MSSNFCKIISQTFYFFISDNSETSANSQVHTFTGTLAQRKTPSEKLKKRKRKKKKHGKRTEKKTTQISFKNIKTGKALHKTSEETDLWAIKVTIFCLSDSARVYKNKY